MLSSIEDIGVPILYNTIGDRFQYFLNRDIFLNKYICSTFILGIKI